MSLGNSLSQVLTSTSPVVGRPALFWKSRTAALVCGPKTPSCGIWSFFCSDSTAGLLSPNWSSTRCMCRWSSLWATVFTSLPESSFTALLTPGYMGEVATAADTAYVAVLRREISLLALSARARRRRDRSSERSHSWADARSRLLVGTGTSCGRRPPTRSADGLALDLRYAA